MLYAIEVSSRRRGRVAAGEADGNAQSGQWRSALMPNVANQPSLRRDQGLDLSRHAIEILPEPTQLVVPVSQRRSNPRAQIAGGDLVTRRSHVRDRQRDMPGEKDAQNQHDEDRRAESYDQSNAS